MKLDVFFLLVVFFSSLFYMIYLVNESLMNFQRICSERISYYKALHYINIIIHGESPRGLYYAILTYHYPNGYEKKIFLGNKDVILFPKELLCEVSYAIFFSNGTLLIIKIWVISLEYP